MSSHCRCSYCLNMLKSLDPTVKPYSRLRVHSFSNNSNRFELTSSIYLKTNGPVWANRFELLHSITPNLNRFVELVHSFSNNSNRLAQTGRFELFENEWTLKHCPSSKVCSLPPRGQPASLRGLLAVNCYRPPHHNGQWWGVGDFGLSICLAYIIIHVHSHCIDFGGSHWASGVPIQIWSLTYVDI